MSDPTILISAGEASGDLYAAALTAALRRRWPEAEFFGCAGPRMAAAGVEQVVDAGQLSVVGLAEVVRDIPRIYGEFRELAAEAERRQPRLAVLTDSPSFHLRLAKKLKRHGIPVIYLVAPQIWAWKKWRVRQVRRDVDLLLCIFPFEEQFFRGHGVKAVYIGHPLTRIIRPRYAKGAFLAKHGIPRDRPLLVLLPGSRAGEAARHLSLLAEAADRLHRDRPAAFILAAPPGAVSGRGPSFWEPISRSPIKIIEGETWDAIAHADLALAASGTVTVEAALLGTPMVTFYRVSEITWLLGRLLVDVPFYSMVNLIAGRQGVPEIMQHNLTGARLAHEAALLLGDGSACGEMKRGLSEVAGRLAVAEDPLERAADLIEGFLK